MKFVIRFKGGKGSGHHGHEGIPGHQGGSLPGKGRGLSPEQQVNVFAAMMKDPEARRLMIALGADGTGFSYVNLDEVDAIKGAILTMVDPSRAGSDNEGVDYIEENSRAYKKMEKMVDELNDDYTYATERDGWYNESSTITDARKKWEEAYYGKVVNGHDAGANYATERLNEIANTIAEGSYKPGSKKYQPDLPMSKKAKAEQKKRAAQAEHDKKAEQFAGDSWHMFKPLIDKHGGATPEAFTEYAKALRKNYSEEFLREFVTRVERVYPYLFGDKK